ncbi:hypothetical protein [Primorskyibacter sp. 2E233]|uniref:hypothetical protein n=1 Tax=Primorskyibacter sp. 2E233 TaxID=3413431 RepID=UPI003BEF758B
MTRIAPISRATLDAVLLNEHLESVLTIGEGPKTLMLELTNLLGANDISIGDAHGSSLVLTFRPGALNHIDQITVGDGWTLGRLKGAFIPSLELTHKQGVTLKPGEKLQIALSNLTASAAGASRSTRVEMAYANVAVAGGPQLSGRRTIHLSLLYPNVPAGQVIGQTGVTGSFKAELLSSADVLISSKRLVNGQPETPMVNDIRIRLSASAPVPIKANASGQLQDDVAKVSFHFPGDTGDTAKLSGKIVTTQDVTTHTTFPPAAFPPPSGIGRGHPMGPFFNPSTAPIVTTVQKDRWQAHGDIIYYASQHDDPLFDDFLEFGLSITTSLKPGAYPLTIRLENVNQQNVDIVLLLNVTAIGLPGMDPADGYINAPGSLTINTPKTLIKGDLTVDKKLTVNSNEIHFGNDWHIGAATNWFYFRNQKNLSIMFFQEDNNAITIGTGTNVDKPLRIWAPKNVGINTNSPKATLDVNGSLEAKTLQLNNAAVALKFAYGWDIYIYKTQFIIQQNSKNLAVFNSNGDLWLHGVVKEKLV